MPTLSTRTLPTKALMQRQKVTPADLQIHPLTPRRWKDLETLFGERGACAGCWCMWWRLPRPTFDEQRGEANRKALKRTVYSGELPGLIAYRDGEPIGWCALSPRTTYPRLDRSRLFRKIDEQPVWSIVCFFVARPYRRQRVCSLLLEAAVAHARKNGAGIVEGYPVDEKAKKADPSVYTGLASMFRAAGFEEVARRSPTRPIMRRYLR